MNNALFAQSTYVPDNNFEQALIDLGYDDILDDYVLTANISGLLNLSIPYKSISDATGLEDFASLRSINCDDNNLTSIPFHPNVNLSTFICNNNLLDEIDVSQHTQLMEFGCINNNISNLDLSQNPMIRYLYIGGLNTLTSIDTSQLPLLRDLWCSGTGITSFDFSQNPELGDLDCENTNITSLDLSNNPNLFSIVASNNNLQNVDLRNGNNNNIGGNFWNFNFTNNPNLPYIFVDDCVYSTNNWTSIDPTTIFIENEGEIECENLSVSDYSFNKNIILSPNPTENTLTIDNINNLTIKSISISTLDGKIINKISNDFKKIDISSFNSGIYLLIINTERGNLIKKIIKK